MSSRSERQERLRDQRQRVNANATKHRKSVEPQKKARAVRAKYGPKRRPSPVVVKSLATGEVLKVVDQGKFVVREYSQMLNALARGAGFESYAAYIDSPYWKGIRERVLSRDRHRCRGCGGSKGVSVHHDRYDFIRQERLEFLKAMCAKCHRHIHR